MRVLGLSFAKQVFIPESRERARMVGYGSVLEAYTLIVLTRKSDGFTEKVTEGNFVAYPTNSKTKLLMLWDAYWLARKILREGGSEDTTITAQDPFETGLISYLVSRACRVPLHIQVHGSFFSSVLWKNESLLNRLRYHLGIALIRRASHVRVVSERIKRSLVALGIHSEKITVLPIRTELDRLLEIPRAWDLSQNDDVVTVLAAGRLAPEKNLPLLLRAVSMLRGRVHLRIVGSGPEEGRLRALTKSLRLEQAVTFIPWVQDIVEEMKRAHIYVLTSDHEGYALVLVEAMAAGLPVVTTDVGCAGEVLKDGVHGRVVPVGDVTRLGEALQALIDTPALRVEYGKAGRETATTIARMSDEEYRHAWVASLSSATETV